MDFEGKMRHDAVTAWTGIVSRTSNKKYILLSKRELCAILDLFKKKIDTGGLSFKMEHGILYKYTEQEEDVHVNIFESE